jgi:hypothetical protein
MLYLPRQPAAIIAKARKLSLFIMVATPNIVIAGLNIEAELTTFNSGG